MVEAKHQALQTIRHAIAIQKAGDTEQARSLIQKGWRICPADDDVLKAAAGSMIDFGDFDAAIDMLRGALAHQSETPTLYLIAANLGMRMQQYDFAEKLYEVAIQKDGTSQPAYVGWITAIIKQDHMDRALECLQSLIPQFEGNAKLWSLLGTVARWYLKDFASAEKFYLEAHRLDPNDIDILMALTHLYHGSPKGKEYFEKAMNLDGKNSLLRFNYGLYLLSRGDFGRADKDLAYAWQLYESRLDPSFGYTKVAASPYGIPKWQGEGLEQKSILLMAEQGIGDEVLFSLLFGKICERAETVYIGCDPRLVSIYERNFPMATVMGFKDKVSLGTRTRYYPLLDEMSPNPKIDFAIPIGSLPNFFWRTSVDMIETASGHLKPDDSLVQTITARLPDAAGRKRIGISWRSGKASFERNAGYLNLPNMLHLIRNMDALFVNMQYSITDEEQRALMDVLGDRYVTLENVDLKTDIEANFALASAMDLVIGPAISTQVFAMTTGTRTWVVNHGYPWWAFGQKDVTHPPFSPNCEFVIRHSLETWQTFLDQRLVPKLSQFLEGPASVA